MLKHLYAHWNMQPQVWFVSLGTPFHWNDRSPTFIWDNMAFSMAIHLIPKAWSEHGVEALWTGQRNILLPVHNASTLCSLQAFGIRCISLVLPLQWCLQRNNQILKLTPGEFICFDLRFTGLLPRVRTSPKCFCTRSSEFVAHLMICPRYTVIIDLK